MSLWGNFFALNDLFIYGTFIPVIRIPSLKRIGPHNKNIIEFFYGSLLGDGYLERHGNGIRLCIQQENSHKDYLYWLHNYLASLGYTNSNIPLIQSRIGLKGKLRYLLRFKTWTYSNQNFLYDQWYKFGSKILPLDISDYLTPMAQAIWIMDDGSRSGKGLKLSTNNLSFHDCNRLANILRTKYKQKISIHKTGYLNQWNLYIHKSSIKDLYEIVKLYYHPSMKYKFHI